MDRPWQTRREAGTQSQGSSLGKTARLPVRTMQVVVREVDTVKARLTKLTWALALLASMALTLGAGIRWC